MGFVVYSKKDGEMLRYYDTRSRARAQVTAHNRRAIVEALKGNENVTEWGLCEWSEYEEIFSQYYSANKWHYLYRPSY